jgi:hypothetical protein
MKSKLDTVQRDPLVDILTLDSASCRLAYCINILTYLWCRVLLEKLTGLQLVKKFPHFTEPEGSLPHS